MLRLQLTPLDQVRQSNVLNNFRAYGKWKHIQIWHSLGSVLFVAQWQKIPNFNVSRRLKSVQLKCRIFEIGSAFSSMTPLKNACEKIEINPNKLFAGNRCIVGRLCRNVCLCPLFCHWSLFELLYFGCDQPLALSYAWAAQRLRTALRPNKIITD